MNRNRFGLGALLGGFLGFAVGTITYLLDRLVDIADDRHRTRLRAEADLVDDAASAMPRLRYAEEDIFDGALVPPDELGGFTLGPRRRRLVPRAIGPQPLR